MRNRHCRSIFAQTVALAWSIDHSASLPASLPRRMAALKSLPQTETLTFWLVLSLKCAQLQNLLGQRAKSYFLSKRTGSTFFFNINTRAHLYTCGRTPAALENLIPSSDSTTARLTEWLHTVFDPFLFNHPQLCILSAPQAKVWKVYIDLIILSASTQSGTLFDVATLATKAALWDLRIPKTRGVAFHSRQAAAPSSSGQQDQVDQMEMLGMKGLLRSGKPRQDNKNAGQVDFELESYWDEGLPLSNRESLPVAVTLHLVRVVSSYARNVH